MKEINVTPDYSVRLADDKANIFVVDDELVVYNVLELAIKEYGHNPVIARNTQEGRIIVDAIAENGKLPLDIAILDIIMPPGMEDGFGFADYLKKEYRYENIIYITGFGDKPEIQEQLIEREKPYYTKPFKLKELKKGIDDILNK